MKNLKLISLTLGITLFCNLNKSSAESFTYNRLLSDARYPYFAITISKMLADMPNQKIDDFSTVNLNIKDNGIEVSGRSKVLVRGNTYAPTSFVLIIPYKKAKYDELTALQKKIFDYYNFDKTQKVNVIGLSMDNFYQSFLLGGSISVSEKVGYIKYKKYSSAYASSSSYDYYQLLDESNPSMVIASLTRTSSPWKNQITLDQK